MWKLAKIGVIHWAKTMGFSQDGFGSLGIVYVGNKITHHLGIVDSHLIHYIFLVNNSLLQDGFGSLQSAHLCGPV